MVTLGLTVPLDGDAPYLTPVMGGVGPTGRLGLTIRSGSHP